MPTWSIASWRSSRPGLHVGDRQQRLRAARVGSWRSKRDCNGSPPARLTRPASPTAAAAARRSGRATAAAMPRASRPHVGEQELRRVAVVDEAVGQPEMQHRHHDAGRGQRLGHAAAGAARDDVLLDGHERVVLARELADERRRRAASRSACWRPSRRAPRPPRAPAAASAPNARIATRCARRAPSRRTSPLPTGSAFISRVDRDARARRRADSAPPPACRA